MRPAIVGRGRDRNSWNLPMT